MNEILKMRIIWALMIQGLSWILGLAIIGVLSITASKDTCDLFQALLGYVFIGMFFGPLIGLFIFLPTVSGLFKKTAYALGFVIALWAVTLIGALIFSGSSWKPLYEKTEEKKLAALKPQYDAELKKAEGAIDSLKTPEEADQYVQAFIVKRGNEGFNYPVNWQYEESEYLIRFLANHRKTLGDRAVAKMFLLLNQYAGASDGEDLAYNYSKIFYSSTEEAVEAMSDAQSELLPGFKKQDPQWLYGNGCGLPQEFIDGPPAEKLKAEKLIKSKLQAMKNPSNAAYIDYLFKNKCFDE